MKNLRCYYSAPLEVFLGQDPVAIFGEICGNSTNAEVTVQQQSAWKDEINILQTALLELSSRDGRILFEYVIPRRGKRVDVVLLHRNIVFCWRSSVGTICMCPQRLSRCMITHLTCIASRKKAMTSLLFR